jgi:hypothetical protein
VQYLWEISELTVVLYEAYDVRDMYTKKNESKEAWNVSLQNSVYFDAIAEY